MNTDACFASLSLGGHVRHRLHGQDRTWAETNCWVDLWIEAVAAIGAEPEAMLGFTVTQDFEGDQFTFFKAPPEDLEALYGVTVQELAVYDPIERHAAVQLARGRLCLIEVDPYFLPDTRGLSYALHHGKTTIGVNRLDIAGRRLEYLHNAGYFALEGKDFDDLFAGHAHGDTPFLPYAEFAKFGPRPGGDLRPMAADILRRRLARRPAANPVRAFAAVLVEQARGVAEREDGFFHHYAFNTLRQLGANFQLLGDHLVWLDGAEGPGAVQAQRIAETAKLAQFQLARACARGRYDALPAVIAPAVDAYDALFDDLARRA